MPIIKSGRYHIIGAGRGIGRWFSQELSERGHIIYGYDVAADTLSGLPRTIISCPIDESCTYSQYAENFRSGDIVLLAVPETKINSLRETLLPVARDALLVSLTSVQAQQIKVLSQWELSLPPLGCHPLFGSTVNSPAGQIIALIDYQQSEPLHVQFSDHIRDLGLIPSYLRSEVHDEYMGLIQALPHFCFLVFVKCLTKLSNNPSSLFDLRTPNFEFLHAFACRFLKITPTTTASIQFTPGASRIRYEFIEAAKELSEAMDAAETIESISKIIFDTRDPLDGAHIDEGAQIAAVAVDSIQRFENLLHRYLISQSPFVFKNRISGNIHVVRIIQNNSTDIEYEEATLIRDGKYAIGLDEVSRQNYQRIGINIGNAYKYKVKKRNIVLLAACRTNDKEAGRKKCLGFPFYVPFCDRQPCQSHSTPKKSQLAALYT